MKRTKRKKVKRKKPEAEDIQAFAISVSKRFWPAYGDFFRKKCAMDFPDLVQECVLAYYKVKHKYNPRYELSTYAYAVMKKRLYVLINKARAQKRSGKMIELSELLRDKGRRDLLYNKTATPLKPYGLKPISLEELKLVEKLTDIERRRLIAHFFDGKEPKQIAKEENVTSKAVNESIRGALKKLRLFLK